jgi:hypothetical protein
MGQFSDITICDLFLLLFFLSRTNPVAKMGIVYDRFQKEQLSETLAASLACHPVRLRLRASSEPFVCTLRGNSAKGLSRDARDASRSFP